MINYKINIGASGIIIIIMTILYFSNPPIYSTDILSKKNINKF